MKLNRENTIISLHQSVYFMIHSEVHIYGFIEAYFAAWFLNTEGVRVRSFQSLSGETIQDTKSSGDARRIQCDLWLT